MLAEARSERYRNLQLLNDAEICVCLVSALCVFCSVYLML